MKHESVLLLMLIISQFKNDRKFNHKCHVCEVQNELSVITGLKSYHLYDDGDQKLTS